MRPYKIAYAVVFLGVLLVVATPIHAMIAGVFPRFFGVPFSIVFVVAMAFLPSIALFLYDRIRFPGIRLSSDD